MKIRNNNNSHMFPNSGEKKDPGVSLTVPSMALSVRQIIGRLEKGLPINVPVNQSSISDPENVYIDPIRLDIIDRNDYMDKLARQWQEDQEKAKKRQEEYSARLAQKKADDEAILAYIKANPDVLKKTPESTNNS